MAKRRAHLKRPLPLGDVLSGGTWGKRGENLVSMYRIQKAWEEVVGKDLASRTLPKRISGKKLLVSVENPAWSQHLSLMKDQILEVICQRTGKQFDGIRFITETLPEKPKAKSVPRIETNVQSVDRSDESLADLMKRLQKKAAALRKVRNRQAQGHQDREKNRE